MQGQRCQHFQGLIGLGLTMSLGDWEKNLYSSGFPRMVYSLSLDSDGHGQFTFGDSLPAYAKSYKDVDVAMYDAWTVHFEGIE